jgi:predicted kinase
LIVMVGAPGTGKSFLARQIAEAFDAVLIQTDAVRKHMFRQPRYTDKETRAVYAESRRRIDAGLAARRRVIFDATNMREHRRALLYEVGERAGAVVAVVRAYAPDDVVRARVTRRFIVPDPLDQSDADWRISRLLHKQAQPIRYPHLVVNTTVSPAPALRALARVLGTSGL